MTEQTPEDKPSGGFNHMYAKQLLELRQDLIKLRQRLDALPDVAALRGLVNEVAALSARVVVLEKTTPDQGKSPRVWDFTTPGPERDAAWAQLNEWVVNVLGPVYRVVGDEDRRRERNREADARLPRMIPPCWNTAGEDNRLRHLDLVIELGWLCQEWLRTFRTPEGNPGRAGDWHDRHLPGLRKRIWLSSAAKCKYGHDQEEPPLRPPAR
ncbi:hypothetical protein ACWENQ_45605 [Nonomuraea sp. NPDC004354]